MPLTVPNLDDRTFDDLYDEVRARVPVHAPEWTNLGENDPGVALLQLFAFLVDNMSYRSNRIPEATRRTFLTLLGMGLQPATPATGFVTFSAEQSTTIPTGSIVRAGKVQFRTQRSVQALPVEAHVYWKQPRTDLDADTLEHLQRLHEPFLGAGASQLAFYDPIELAAPATGAPLPAIDLADPVSGPVDGAIWVALAASETAVHVAGDDPDAAVAALRPVIAGATLTLTILPGPDVDGRSLDPRRIVPASSDPGLLVEASGTGAEPDYQRLVATHTDDVLDRPGVIDVQLPALAQLVGPWVTDPSTEGTGDRPPLVKDRAVAARIVTWLRIRRRTRGSASVAPGGAVLSWVGVNGARVVQSVHVDQERVGVGSGSPDQRFRLANTPVLIDRTTSHPLIEVQGPTGSWEQWDVVDDLHGAAADAKVCMLDAESGVLGTGSGLHGSRVPLDAAVRATYDHGGGPQGVVPIDAISIADTRLGAVKVRNPLATWGGAAGESIAEGERTIPSWLRHRDRAVTAADFRDIALSTPGVDLGRVDVMALFDPRPATTASGADPTDAAGAVTVMVVPRADGLAATPPATIDPHVLEAVCAWLDPRRLITTQVFVRGARWVPVVVSVGIALMPGEVREEVEQRVRTALRGYLSPLTGGLGASAGDGIAVEATGVSPTGWPLGSSVRVDDLTAAVTRVAGVRYVDGIRLAANRGGTIISDVVEVPLTGLELPNATVFVTTGPPEDPAALLGASLPGASIVPVPVIPRKC